MSANLGGQQAVVDRLAVLGYDAGNPKEVARAARRHRELRARVARHDPNMFCAYVLRDERTGKPIQQAPMHEEWHRLMTDHDRLLMWSHVEGGKALALDTPIPTPRGFTNMGDLRTGDTVLGGDGRPCTVLQAHVVRTDRACFVVRFDDGAEVTADAEHNWLAWSLDDMAARRAPRVVTTAELRERLKRGRDFMWKVPVAGVAQHETAALPIAPYLLGAWLGDGCSANSKLTFHAGDSSVWERCRDLAGGSCPPVADVRNPNVMTATLGPATNSRSQDGLRAALRELGVLDNKHIPMAYLTADEGQRRGLLAGLLDTDGCAVHESGRQKSRVEFCSSLEVLARGVLQLARSLGFKARIAESESKLYGCTVGRRWRVTFTARERVFFLERKQALLGLGGDKPKHRTVIAVEPVASVPVRCITVDSADHTYLAGTSYTVTHNTNQVAIGRVLFELGQDPNLRVAVVSNTSDLAQKMTRAIGQYIEKSQPLHEVFPNLVPTNDPSLPWKAKALTIQRAGVGGKDPSIQATGVHGNIIGSRIDLLVLDDILDHENTHNPGPRADTLNWIKSSLFSRLTANARVWFVGNAWHPDDAMHMLEKEPRFVGRRFPVISPEGVLTWPERWSLDRIDLARMDLGPLEYSRQLLCQARDDSSARFKREWLDVCIRRGDGLQITQSITDVLDWDDLNPEELVAARESLWRLGASNMAVFTGVDLAVQRHSAADKTVLFTVLVHPNGDRQVLNIRSGRWNGPEIIRQIRKVHEDFGSIVIVENNAAQEYILQFLRDQSAVPVKAFTTGRNKADPSFGVESLATEFANGKWLIPNEGGEMHAEVAAWISELLFYDPSEHTGDRVMASWFAREGARMFDRGASRSINVRVF